MDQQDWKNSIEADLADRRKHSNWKCPKCEGLEFDVDEIQTAGGSFSAYFNFQNRKFVSVTCTNCQYTEFYKGHKSQIAKILDFLGG